ncbi:MAG TPA: ribosome recycling factor [Candidatus Marinimicrobia bacterium]|jgi:ribosome recycling factor|nr:ribosome recycling factor [Candidatus Neomarinimicrobiota bacterium]HIB13965.1 ribosome recycling factor [Candidatus Neomarinimicrobiota bacterium]HIM53536.1 ribosome recycling factor [Candidatus Neomarinimicrobiota bacterium]HIN19450.1 ribosome recycling factor [Candidatus Neomarinimicrobiota bacterium]|tara:strand:- start:550 stop:1104 length:555 start_codon:yes stop_codon:yes gene_type:complete
MINELFVDVKDRMNKAVEHYRHEVSTIRTGRASANILDVVKVDYYGTPTPLNNIAHVTVPEGQLIVIQPFDPSSLEFIEKAIMSSDVGLTPNNDGSVIRLNIPTLTEERRKDLVKVVHKIIEEGRVAVRNIRRDANDLLKKSEKDNDLSEDNLRRATDNIQEMTDEHIKNLNQIQEAKEKDILD